MKRIFVDVANGRKVGDELAMAKMCDFMVGILENVAIT